MKLSESATRTIHSTLREAGINFVVNLPDSWMLHVISFLRDDKELTFVGVTREEEGVGLACGGGAFAKDLPLIVYFPSDAHFSSERSQVDHAGFLSPEEGLIVEQGIFEEQVQAEETRCLATGNPCCRFLVRAL